MSQQPTESTVLPEELGTAFAIMAVAGHWYQLELSEGHLSCCVRNPIGPTRTTMWVQPLGDVPLGQLPRVLVASRLRANRASWQDPETPLSDHLFRVIELMRRAKVSDVLVEQVCPAPVGTYRVSTGQPGSRIARTTQVVELGMGTAHEI